MRAVQRGPEGPRNPEVQRGPEGAQKGSRVNVRTRARPSLKDQGAPEFEGPGRASLKDQGVDDLKFYNF